jgi:hypothetical protein
LQSGAREGKRENWEKGKMHFLFESIPISPLSPFSSLHLYFPKKIANYYPFTSNFISASIVSQSLAPFQQKNGGSEWFEFYVIKQ